MEVTKFLNNCSLETISFAGEKKRRKNTDLEFPRPQHKWSFISYYGYIHLLQSTKDLNVKMEKCRFYAFGFLSAHLLEPHISNTEILEVDVFR